MLPPGPVVGAPSYKLAGIDLKFFFIVPLNKMFISSSI